MVHQKFDNGSYTLNSPDGSKIIKPHNGSKLKPYFHSEHLQTPDHEEDQDPGEEILNLIVSEKYT